MYYYLRDPSNSLLPQNISRENKLQGAGIGLGVARQFLTNGSCWNDLGILAQGRIGFILKSQKPGLQCANHALNTNDRVNFIWSLEFHLFL